MIKAKGIKPDSLIDVKISGQFYGRLQTLSLWIAGLYTSDEFLKYVALIKEKQAMNPTSDPEAYNIETVVALIREIEDCASSQGLVVDIEVPEPDPS